MSAAEAIRAARDAGVDITIDGNDLLLEASAPPPAELVDRLSRHKADIIAFLAAVAFESNHFSTRAWVPTCESAGELAEPGLEEPCATRRGLMVEGNGVLLHFCVECGRLAVLASASARAKANLAGGIAASIGHGLPGVNRRVVIVGGDHDRDRNLDRGGGGNRGGHGDRGGDHDREG